MTTSRAYLHPRRLLLQISRLADKYRVVYRELHSPYMPDFTRIIHLAYQRILGRPADLDGLDNYNRLMNRGLSEADMRESLLRSAEYGEKNPGPGAAAGARTTRRKKKSGRSGRRSSAPRK